MGRRRRKMWRKINERKGGKEVEERRRWNGRMKEGGGEEFDLGSKGREKIKEKKIEKK